MYDVRRECAMYESQQFDWLCGVTFLAISTLEFLSHGGHGVLGIKVA